jgi:hypothetical protein
VAPAVDERELAEHERRARDSVAGDLRAALDGLQNTATAVYIAVAGDTRHKLAETAQTTLRGHLVDVLTTLERRSYATTRHVLIGAARGAMAGGAADLDAQVPIRLPLDVRAALKALTTGMRADLADARRLAQRGSLDRYGDLQAVLALAKRALNRADRAASWVVHRAHNEGRSRAIDRLWRDGIQVQRLWRAEQDACPLCLSYAGALAEPGEPFAPVVSVADPSARPDGPLHNPPAHPFCRCEVEWWFGAPERELTTVDLPVALRREAQRSIAAGRAQGSLPARLRAADRLLAVASDAVLLPKTVLRRARKAVEAGRFQR